MLVECRRSSILDQRSDEAWVAAAKTQQEVALGSFVASLRTPWQDGEVRPTSQPKPKGNAAGAAWTAVTDHLRSWFEADPSLSARQLLYRLQTKHPGEYPDVLVRTVQRRLKNWRSALALALVFGRDRASNRSRVTTISRARRDAGNLPGSGGRTGHRALQTSI